MDGQVLGFWSRICPNDTFLFYAVGFPGASDEPRSTYELLLLVSQLRTESVRSAQYATFDSCIVCFLVRQLLVAADKRSDGR